MMPGMPVQLRPRKPLSQPTATWSRKVNPLNNKSKKAPASEKKAVDASPGKDITIYNASIASNAPNAVMPAEGSNKSTSAPPSLSATPNLFSEDSSLRPIRYNMYGG